MQGKFRFSLDGVDATARQFVDVRRRLEELFSSVGKSVSRLGRRVTDVEKDFESLVTERSQADAGKSNAVVDAGDADEFIPVDALRQVKWRVYWLKDELNLKLDDAQPVVGLIAEDLDDAGLGFFCEYDGDGNPTGVDYPRLSVAALRLAQQAMSEVDELRTEVARLSSLVGKMGVSTSE